MLSTQKYCGKDRSFRIVSSIINPRLQLHGSPERMWILTSCCHGWQTLRTLFSKDLVNLAMSTSCKSCVQSLVMCWLSAKLWFKGDRRVLQNGRELWRRSQLTRCQRQRRKSCSAPMPPWSWRIASLTSQKMLGSRGSQCSCCNWSWSKSV